MSTTRVRPYGKQISNKKGLNIDLTIGQYEMLYNLLCDAYDRGYDQRPRIDTQTFDNMFDAVVNATETYLKWRQLTFTTCLPIGREKQLPIS